MGEPEDETFVVDLHYNAKKNGAYTVNKSIPVYVIPEIIFTCTVETQRKKGEIIGMMIKNNQQTPPANIKEWIINITTQVLSDKPEYRDIRITNVSDWHEVVLTWAEYAKIGWIHTDTAEITLCRWDLRNLILSTLAHLHARLTALETIRVDLYNREAVSEHTEKGEFVVLPAQRVDPIPIAVSKNKSTYHPAPLANPKKQIFDVLTGLSKEQLLRDLHKIGYTDAMESDKEALKKWMQEDELHRNLWIHYKAKDLVDNENMEMEEWGSI